MKKLILILCLMVLRSATDACAQPTPIFNYFNIARLWYGVPPPVPIFWSAEAPTYRRQYMNSAYDAFMFDLPAQKARVEQEAEDKLNSLNYYFQFDRLQATSPQIIGMMGRAKMIGEITGYDNGEKHGYLEEKKNLGREGQMQATAIGEEFPPIALIVPAIDPDIVFALFRALNARNTRGAFLGFANAIGYINEAIILSLSEGQGLDSKDRDLLRARYAEIHPLLSKLLYRKFLQLCRSQKIGKSKGFYSFPNYRIAVNFNLLLSSSTPSVLDALYTYLWQDWALTTENGMKALGTISRQVSEVLLPAIENQVYTAALRIDYDAELPHLTRKAQALFRMLTVETRKDSQSVSGNYSIGGRYTAEIKMDIKTIVKLRFDVQKINITVDHCQRQFRIQVPDAPRLLEVVMQDYIVRSVENTIVEPCGPLPSRQKRKFLPHYAIKQVFRKNRTSPKSLDICKNPLDADIALRLLNPLLKKLFEPSAALFHSDYEVVLSFGGNDYRLIQK